MWSCTWLSGHELSYWKHVTTLEVGRAHVASTHHKNATRQIVPQTWWCKLVAKRCRQLSQAHHMMIGSELHHIQHFSNLTRRTSDVPRCLSLNASPLYYRAGTCGATLVGKPCAIPWLPLGFWGDYLEQRMGKWKAGCRLRHHLLVYKTHWQLLQFSCLLSHFSKIKTILLF